MTSVVEGRNSLEKNREKREREKGEDEWSGTNWEDNSISNEMEERRETILSRRDLERSGFDGFCLVKNEYRTEDGLFSIL